MVGKVDVAVDERVVVTLLVELEVTVVVKEDVSEVVKELVGVVVGVVIWQSLKNPFMYDAIAAFKEVMAAKQSPLLFSLTKPNNVTTYGPVVPRVNS